MKASMMLSPLRWVSEWSPLLALTALLVLPMLLSQAPAANSAIDHRNAQVRAAVANAPWRIGDWVGEDVPVPAAAVEILRSNTILSRRFSKYDGGSPAVTLLIVHCSDARDMEGHFPPFCYPNSGWIAPEYGAVSEVQAVVMGRPVNMRAYSFYQSDGWGSIRSLRVLNYFVLPSGRVVSDTSVVNSLGRRYETSIQGVAQVQLVMPGEMSMDESVRAAGELLTGVDSILAVLGQGVQ